MLKEFVEKINSLKDFEEIEVEDHAFYKEGYKKFSPPVVNEIIINTLQGFCDFVPTIENEYNLYIIIESPYKVSLISDIDKKYKKRQIYCSAVLDRAGVPFTWRNTEDFNVFLQANFQHTEDKDKILELIGNITDEEIKNYSDNGITQTTTKTTGLSRKEKAVVPNPVSLAPYRTFIDVQQPESVFVFRMRSQGRPECNLFLSDGDLWKVKAINNIKNYLNENIEGIPIIG